MLYELYDAQRAALASASVWSSTVSDWITAPLHEGGMGDTNNTIASALDVFAHATRSYGKPSFGLRETVHNGIHYSIREDIAARTPFGNLLHFIREGAPPAPKLLMVAPMSGHYATLLRGTVEALLPHYDVFITDWADAKHVSLSDGTFDLNDYIETLMSFLGVIGSGAHIVAVCQPSVPVYAATAVMNANQHPCTPRSITLMGGPIDTRQAPTPVNLLAKKRPMAWYEQNAIVTVPAYYSGAFRRVYPGFLQLSGFMGMNLGNHLISHWNMFKQLVRGDGQSAAATKDFYEEYRSVCDMTAEFYLQTVECVFKQHALPLGDFIHRKQRVDPTQIKKTAILCVEGERDDISGVGQTRAALTLATKLPDDKKRYFLAEGVGHYGIFNGRKWREMIAPEVIKFITQHDHD